MAGMTKKSIDTMKLGLKSLKNIKKDKQEYREYLGRINALPDEYKFVFEKATAYMWGFAGGNGYDMIALQEGLLELFEASATDGKGVLEVTGEDVATFCDELLKNARTYTEKRREKLNQEILKKLEENTKESAE